ncbi:MAG: hypothetical protein AAF662_09040 [Pseudomonadota bacterium]
MEWVWVAKRCAFAVVGGYVLAALCTAAFSVINQLPGVLGPIQAEVWRTVVTFATFFAFAWVSLTAKAIRGLSIGWASLCSTAALVLLGTGQNPLLRFSL